MESGEWRVESGEWRVESVSSPSVSKGVANDAGKLPAVRQMGHSLARVVLPWMALRENRFRQEAAHLQAGSPRSGNCLALGERSLHLMISPKKSGQNEVELYRKSRADSSQSIL